MIVPQREVNKVFAYPPPPPEVESPYRKNPPERLSLDEILATGVTEEQLIEIFSNRIDAFATLVLADYIKGPHSKMHMHMYNLFKNKVHTGAREVVIAPRGSAKSSLVTLAFPLWALCYSKYHFIIIASDTQDQAEDFLSCIKEELESNEVIKRLYPHVFGKGSTWRNDRIITRSDVLVRSMGSGGKVRGRRYKNWRPDLLLLDDVENKQMIDSDTIRRSLVTWFDQDVCKSGSRAQDVDIFVVGTILHRDSLLNQLYESKKYASWNTTKFQAVEGWCSNKDGMSYWADWKRVLTNRYDPLREYEALRLFLKHKKEMMEGASVMWSNWDTYYSLMYEMVTDGEVAFYKERQNIPQSPDERIFTNITYYKEDEFEALKGLFTYSLYLDSSIGQGNTVSKKHDFSAITVVARHSNTGYSFVRKSQVDRVPVSKQVDNIVYIVLELNSKSIYPRVGVESNAFQSILGDELKKKLNEAGARYEKIVKIHHAVEKHTRLESLEPPIKNGSLRFREGEDQELINELEWFPQGHEDAIDSLEGAYSMLNQKLFKPIYASTVPNTPGGYTWTKGYSSLKDMNHGMKPTYLYD